LSSRPRAREKPGPRRDADATGLSFRDIMNGKNLALKFVLLAAAVLVFGWALWAYGLDLGIDLRGGHSLIFQLRTPQTEIERIDEQLAALDARLEAVTDEDDRAELLDTRQQLERERQRYEQQAAGVSADLVQQVIKVIRDRIDPQGLLNLEIRPVGENRIEIRMPAAKPETREAKNRYIRALDELKERNIQRAEVLRLVELPPDERSAEIERLSGGDNELAAMLRAIVAANDGLVAARERMEGAEQAQDQAIRTGADASRLEQLSQRAEEAKAAFTNARSAYKDTLDRLWEKNVSPERVQRVLNGYLSKREEQALRKTDPDKANQRKLTFEAQLSDLKADHPRRAEEVQQVADLYIRWAEQRETLEDPDDLKRLIAKAGVLEFRIAPFAPETNQNYKLTAEERDRFVKMLREEGPEAIRRSDEPYAWFPLRNPDPVSGGLIVTHHAGESYILLSNQPGRSLLRDPANPTLWQLDAAWAAPDQMGRPSVRFRMDARGADLFGNLTSANIDNYMAVVLDDVAYSVPIIQSAISSRGEITGDFTPAEARELARILKAGSLPAKVIPDPVSQRSFGPGLGEENRRLGIRAAYAGLIAVAAFMLVYYLLAGLIANVALVLNIILILGVMSLVDAVFTLPGIAGIILTIGMAVDANVLIFERLREEQERGQSLRMALKNAYERAFSAIFDANITTLLVCIILFVVFDWVGMQEVRGFAITLGLGVVFSMFTALLVTRWIFQLLLRAGLLKDRVIMLRLIGTPKVDWMKRRYLFWGLSVALMVLGISSLVWQGGKIWGIEFSAGTETVLELEDDALIDGELPNDKLIRDRFLAQARAMGAEDPTYRTLSETAKVEKIIRQQQVDELLGAYDADGNGTLTRAEWTAAGRDAAFFDRMDAEGDGALSRDELRERLPSRHYQVATTETDANLIVNVAREAFGQELKYRPPCTFEFAGEGEVPQMGVRLTDEATQISSQLAEQSNAAFRNEFKNHEGGLLTVVREVDPPITRADLLDRHRELLLQPDFAGEVRMPEVLGLTPAGEDTYSAFAILVAEGDRIGISDVIAEKQMELTREALKRQESLVTTNFDPAIASQTTQYAGAAVMLSWLVIVGYLWLRFGSVRWGLAAVVCLIHDTIIVVGLVAASGWLYETWLGNLLGISPFKIDLAMVAAILTVIGYSVNDTIVVFDRIRENRGKLPTVTEPVINASINQVLSRTLLTSGTTFIVLLIMYVWGGPGIHAFSYALLVGVVFGTYSSIAVASPQLLGFKRALVARATPATTAE
jgi:SecD/SecF fusion protein